MTEPAPAKPPDCARCADHGKHTPSTDTWLLSGPYFDKPVCSGCFLELLDRAPSTPQNGG